MLRIHKLGWWYWFVTVGLLGAGLTGWTGIFPAMALCAVRIAHVMRLTQDVAAFPVQFRVSYMVMVIVGLWELLQWIHWLQPVGTWARVLIGYCLLAWALSLAPWNRWQPMSFALINWTFFSPRAAVPPCGEVFHRLSLERVSI